MDVLFFFVRVLVCGPKNGSFVVAPLGLTTTNIRAGKSEVNKEGRDKVAASFPSMQTRRYPCCSDNSSSSSSWEAHELPPDSTIIGILRECTTIKGGRNWGVGGYLSV